jgi:hypothetical protein
LTNAALFVLRTYLKIGEYCKEIDAVMKKQSPLLRRAEAAVTRRFGLERAQ